MLDSSRQQVLYCTQTTISTGRELDRYLRTAVGRSGRPSRAAARCPIQLHRSNEMAPTTLPGWRMRTKAKQIADRSVPRERIERQKMDQGEEVGRRADPVVAGRAGPGAEQGNHSAAPGSVHRAVRLAEVAKQELGGPAVALAWTPCLRFQVSLRLPIRPE